MHETLLLVNSTYHYLGMLNFPPSPRGNWQPCLINRVRMREIFRGMMSNSDVISLTLTASRS